MNTAAKATSVLLLSLAFGLSACWSGNAATGSAASGSPAPTTPGSGGAATPTALRLPPVQARFSYNLSSTARLNAGATPDAAVVGLDLLDVTSQTVARLRGAGKYVVCYFSAGSSEAFRTDAGSVALRDGSLNLGTLIGWPDERWLDIRGFGGAATARTDTIRRVMAQRLDLARSKGCDAADFDNVDAWGNVVNTGVSGLEAHAVTADDQLAYNRWLAAQAHARGLAALLKNDLAQIPALAPSFDGAVNEQCFDYAECGALDPFRDAGRAIYVIEYHPAAWVTDERRRLAATHHLNVSLSDLALTRLDPLATFGQW